MLKCNNVHRYYVDRLERKSLLQTHITLTHVSLLVTECAQLAESIHQLHISVVSFFVGGGGKEWNSCNYAESMGNRSCEFLTT